MRDEPACAVRRCTSLQAIAAGAGRPARRRARPGAAEPVRGRLYWLDLLDAGIDDWGGVSPVTDRPREPGAARGPALDRTARRRPSRHGRTLAPRLTDVSGVRRSDNRIGGSTRPCASPVLDRSPTRRVSVATIPARHHPEKVTGRANDVGDRRRGDPRSGRRSTAWYSGATVASAAAARPGIGSDVVGRRGRRGASPAYVAGQATRRGGGRDHLFAARGPEVAAVAALADELRAAAVGDTVTYVRNRNINYTNVCTYKCTFCGFSKGPLSLNLRGKPYLLGARRDRRAGRRRLHELGATEV